MIQLSEITAYLDELLSVDSVPGDASNNGLQVEAGSEVGSAIFGVDACQALFDVAVARNADFIFVHHGLSWGGEPRRFTGIAGIRLGTLFAEGINLYAAHLPLDAHPEIGHNALLADMAGLRQRYQFAEYDGCNIACGGVLPKSCQPNELAKVFEKNLGCQAKIFGNRDKLAEKIGIISGGGGMDGLTACIENDIDCFVTGEMTHTMYHIVKESGITVIQLGHYRSETPGVKAVMDKLNKKFGVTCEFVDIPTGL
jgi:dinuclear metal center YbgI/SA1388 family protein